MMDDRLDDYARVARAIAYVEAHRGEQPDLAAVAASAGLSPYHFQRLFARWVGLSPKKFLQHLTLERARARLAASATVLDAAYEVGLSGPGRLHDLFVAHEAVTPGDVRRRGEGLALAWGAHPSPFGRCVVAATERGLCAVEFVGDGGVEGALAALRARWPRATLREDAAGTGALAARVFRRDAGAPGPLRVFLRGTRFQLQVWSALLRVPAGAVVSYDDLAVSLGKPGAARAVGRAVGSNPLAYVIPCHRVIQKSGDASDYRWGRARKLAMLGYEAAQAEG